MKGCSGKNLVLALSATLISFLGLGGCGNNGGNSGSTSAPQYRIEGKTIKGAVQNATIRVYTVTSQGYRDSAIGQGTTASDGSFSLQATGSGGPVALVVATGGDYIDEATGQRVAISSWVEMSVLVPWPSDNIGLIITPLTRMAAEQGLNRMKSGENPLTALDNAKRSVAGYFSLSGVDISKTVPADPTSPSSAGLSRGNPELEYGLVLAALSQMAADSGMAPSKTLDLVQNIVDDLSDGRLDNVGRNGGALPNMLSITPSEAVNGLDSYINSFLLNSRNATGIGGVEPPPSPPSTPPATTVPSAPTGVTVTPGDGALTVSWSASSGASSYNVYISTTSGAGYVLRASTGSTYLLDTGLTNGTVYYYVVTAVNSYGESAASAEVYGIPGVQICSSGCGDPGACSSHGGLNCSAGPDIDGSVICMDGWRASSVQYSCSSSIPAAPTGVSATAGYASVTVSWSPVTGATSYYVYHSAISGLGTGGTRTSCGGSPCVINGLTNNVWYYFTVSAVNLYGEGPLSTEVYAMPAGPTFTDPNLSSCVAAAMSGLTSVSQLTGLDCVNKSISNLSGIETLTGLQLLNLSNNLITNVTPIASLTGLTDINLSNNSITTGVGTLAASLVNLTGLNIDGNGTGIPCMELTSLINTVMSHGGMAVTQPTSAQTGVNCH